ncbi:helix-turn-helix domain-containing protein [Chitinilyticum piscinae]|uniref:Helix-turn-helix transcriptional regulator n=1 Tax=Chitinilyticum piscinae TaxID=2866724 RepID=A0A8J7FL29_9NEIS|nr:AraC family transcriptional regulator [Chitinilyticum piscinae]MBE9608176.1 helix-turn-helix transcriptional regulator [Chitinilyticum piscinae]
MSTITPVPNCPPRLVRVLHYIDAHLDEPLDLTSLASRAHFSPFHFHRLFRQSVGISPGDYVQRRRLERAARQLREEPQRPVLEIALGNGYQSQGGFNRAFRRLFGMSTKQWRGAIAA